ncbi:hypothetical protein [Engelhardtia mirabilis]|uniref:Imidazolonepropionase n=1 Tax=Engelhardtia mirabilis TaxID=2528011 RepID=A0A518BDI5_9BACT|nr:Imidazolonepropionase [Planctomycetes bacterium Pla133]QDU99377.1 Imidazolonepropionase [Planctomycetes bacterium Pla86]
MHATLIGLALALAPGLPDAPESVATTNGVVVNGAAAPVFAIKATTVVVGDGNVLENGIVVIEGGRIRDVGVGLTLPEGTNLVEHDGVLTAGMVAPQSNLLPASERTDSTRPFLEGAELRFGFDPQTQACEQAAAAGITTAVLTPAASNVVGGLTAVVKTHGGKVVKGKAHLALSVNAAAANTDRYPTSYSGVIAELDARLGEGAEGVYAEARSGALPVLIAATTEADAQRAMALAKRHGLRGALLGARRVGEQQVESLRSSGLAVVFDSFGPGLGERSINAMLAVVEAGLPFAFELTDATRFRFDGAALVRAGADADTVWKAMTSGAAAIAGVGDRVGTLRRGLDADLLLWSGHPLDLTSVLEAVYVGGERVHGGDDQ